MNNSVIDIIVCIVYISTLASFPDKMAEILKEEFNIEEFEIKEDIVSIKEKILPFSTIQDTCTVNINKDDMKIEIKEIQGKLKKISNKKIKNMRCSKFSRIR